MYAGWPANHGAWQWGDEFLVGFMRGPYKRKSMHCIGAPFERVLSRSLDGGRTWTLEIPDVDFTTSEHLQPPPPPRFDLSKHILRVCGIYDHGGDDEHVRGGFYKSADRGHSWDGPYSFIGLEPLFSGDMQCTARTRVHEGTLYLTRSNKLIWGTDETFCATHDGKRFAFKSDVLHDDARAVMPAVARVGNLTVAVMRRRAGRKRDGWLDAVISDDGGLTWSSPKFVGITGGKNGNPPALIALNDDRLVCAFGDRDRGSINVAVSSDCGNTWHVEQLRPPGGFDAEDYDSGNATIFDIGYPQLFKRVDGTPVAVYYWTDKDIRQQHIVATAFKV